MGLIEPSRFTRDHRRFAALVLAVFMGCVVVSACGGTKGEPSDLSRAADASRSSPQPSKEKTMHSRLRISATQRIEFRDGTPSQTTRAFAGVVLPNDGSSFMLGLIVGDAQTLWFDLASTPTSNGLMIKSNVAGDWSDTFPDTGTLPPAGADTELVYTPNQSRVILERNIDAKRADEKRFRQVLEATLTLVGEPLADPRPTPEPKE